MVDPTVHANEGSLATLRVYVSGSPRPDVHWKRGRRTVDTANSARFRLLDGATLQVVGVRRSDEGVYTAVADNGRGRPREAMVTLAVDEPTRWGGGERQSYSRVISVGPDLEVLKC